MAQTMAVNAIAPFVICSLLKVSMMPPSPLNDKNDKTNKTNKNEEVHSVNNMNENNNDNKNKNKYDEKNGNNNENGNENHADSKNNENNNNEKGSRSLDLCYSHIVNVTALEGKFNVGKKSGGHPHTVSKVGRNSVTLILLFSLHFLIR